jgi:hypothetical protein
LSYATIVGRKFVAVICTSAIAGFSITRYKRNL